MSDEHTARDVIATEITELAVDGGANWITNNYHEAADEIVRALEAAGFTVARLELAGFRDPDLPAYYPDKYPPENWVPVFRVVTEETQ